jgi:hypothetical protein
VHINVTDINDNAPDFQPNAIVFFENDPQEQTRTVKVVDADTPIYGPPFTVTPVGVQTNGFQWTFNAQSTCCNIFANNLQRLILIIYLRILYELQPTK